MADKTILTQKLVDLEGLGVFWGKAKEYVDGKISTINTVIEENEKVTAAALTDLDGRVSANASDIATLRADVNALGGAEGGIQGMIDSTIAGLDLPNTYDAKGAAADAKTASVVTITEDAGTGDILKSYTFKQGENTIGTINLAKDLVVTGGAVVEKDGVKYLQLTIANQDTPVEIAVKDLVDVYTGGDYVTIGSDNVITVDKAGIIDGLAVAADVYSKTDADSTFVAKEGYVAYSDAEKTKLAGIAEGAQVNVIESVVVNGVTATVADKVASVTVDCYTKSDVDSAVSKALTDSKAYTDELGKIVKGVYVDGKLTTDGHAQRIEALENVAIATDDDIIALFA